MTTRTELIDLERAGWEASSISGDAATRFYGNHLAHEVLMLLPGGILIDDRDRAIAAMSRAAWTECRLSGEQVLRLSQESTVVAYRAIARRGAVVYTALVSSTYVREVGAWRLAFHQQTPD